MESTIDGGPIVSTYDFEIDKKETGWSLYNKMVTEIPKILDQIIPNIFSDSIEVIKQNEKVPKIKI